MTLNFVLNSNVTVFYLLPHQHPNTNAVYPDLHYIKG
jgi:hypothetical protein